MGDRLLAVDFGTGLTATEVATGCQHVCAIVDGGAVKCFGYNNYGQLGQVIVYCVGFVLCMKA